MWDHIQEISYVVGIIAFFVAMIGIIRRQAKFEAAQSAKVEQCKKDFDSFKEEVFNDFRVIVNGRLDTHNDQIKCMKRESLTKTEHEKETENCQKMNNLMFQKLAESHVRLENTIAHDKKNVAEHMDRLEEVTRELVVAVEVIKNQQGKV